MTWFVLPLVREIVEEEANIIIILQKVIQERDTICEHYYSFTNLSEGRLKTAFVLAPVFRIYKFIF